MKIVIRSVKNGWIVLDESGTTFVFEKGGKSSSDQIIEKVKSFLNHREQQKNEMHKTEEDDGDESCND